MRRRRISVWESRGARFVPALLFTALVLALPASAGAQSSDDLLSAPIPQEIRNALARPTAAPPSTPGLSVLQEGPIDAALYRLGPGDELTVHYTGRTSVTHQLTVSPEGDVYLPDVGTVDVAGHTLTDGKERIRAAARQILRNVRVDVSLTRLRTFKVAVGGEVRVPGVYAATAVTRIHELLREAGGFTDSAAVRDIRLQGTAPGAVLHVDLLPFLLSGRVEGSNPWILDGQSVFVPRRSRLVRVLGAVLHPGTYDLPDSGSTAGALLDLVGLAPDAMVDRIELIPTVGGPQTGLAIYAAEKMPGADGGAPGGTGLRAVSAQRLEHGNQILVPKNGGFARADLVTIEGEVLFPGAYSIAEDRDLKVGDVILAAGGLTAQAVPSRIRLIRPNPDRFSGRPDRSANSPAVQLTATEKELLRARGTGEFRAVIVNLTKEGDGEGLAGSGPVLAPGDTIVVPRAGGSVEVTGRVKTPGFYTYEKDAGTEDYVRRAGGYADRADRNGLRIAAGPGDNFLLAKDAGPPQPGDRIWVPERTPRSTWDVTKDVLLMAGQLATIFIVIDQAGGN
jgi:protein involved in polysaccharide export with SLBB domain